MLSMVMAEEEAAPLVMAYRLTTLERTVKEGFSEVHDLFTNHAVTKLEYEVKHKVLTDRVDALEQDRRTRANRIWAMVVAIAAAVAGDVSAIVVAVRHP